MKRSINKINFKNLLIILFAGSIAFEFFFAAPHHVTYWYHRIPGFYAVFALAACVVLIRIFKTIAHLWLQRNDNYYDRY